MKKKLQKVKCTGMLRFLSYTDSFYEI